MDVRNFFHGSVADRVMRAWLSESAPRSGAMAEMVEDYFGVCEQELVVEQSGMVHWRSRTDRAELIEFCRELVTRLEPMLVRWVLPYDYEPEHRFRVPVRIPYLDGSIAEIELIGGIDVLVRRQETRGRFNGVPQWYAYDLKATANPEYIRKTMAQGIFYDLAVLASQGVSLQEFVFLQPMVEDRLFVPLAVTDDDRRSMLSRIVAVAHARWRGEDAPKFSAAGCSYCSVKFACRKFAPRQSSVFSPVRASGRTEA